MRRPDMKAMLEAGMHYGHSSRYRCPKMKPYIFTKKNGIHIINLEITAKRFVEAMSFLHAQILNEQTVLFVGTKRQAAPLIKQYAESVQMPYVNYRWLGGMMTNFNTIRQSVQKLIGYEKLLESEENAALSKKERLRIQRKMAVLERNLGGIRAMEKLPSILFVVDVKKEEIAVLEANKLGTPVIGIVDTNSSPDNVDYPIPCNDDASKSIDLCLRTVTQTIEDAQKVIQIQKESQKEAEKLNLKPVPKSMAKVKLSIKDKNAKKADKTETEKTNKAEKNSEPLAKTEIPADASAPAAADAGTANESSNLSSAADASEHESDSQTPEKKPTELSKAKPSASKTPAHETEKKPTQGD